MSDLIDREAAIDAVRKNTFRLTFAEEQNCEGHVAWSAEAVYSDVMEGALLELPSAQPKLEQNTHSEWAESDKLGVKMGETCADTISRQAVLSLPRNKTRNFFGEIVEETINVADIEQLPSAHPEIIRCKDCKHRPTATRADERITDGYSVEFPDGTCPCQCEDGWYNHYPDDDFYCGYAERWEE